MRARNGTASACSRATRASRRSRCWRRSTTSSSALLPFSEIAKSDDSNLVAGIDSLIKRNVSVLMLADIGTLPRDIKERVEDWVKKGGVLVRFAGPRLEKGGDDLLPVPLRARRAHARRRAVVVDAAAAGAVRRRRACSPA